MGQCIQRIKRRPFILIFLAVVTIPLCFFEQTSTLVKHYGSFSLLFKNDYMTKLSNFADKISASAAKPGLFLLTIAVSILFVLALSALLGVLMGGYYQNLYMAVNDVPPKKGDFKLGINRHFLKITVFNLAFIIMTILIGSFLLFSLVPFTMNLQMFLAGDSGVIFKMMFLAVVTVLFAYFTTVFYTMYFSYMLPALIGFKKGGTAVSFKMTNGYCWYLMPRTTLFLFLMLLIRVLMLAMSYGSASGGAAVLCFLVNWILTTIVLFGYLYYVFNTFMVMKEDIFTPSEGK